jgi:hypothetical protein
MNPLNRGTDRNEPFSFYKDVPFSPYMGNPLFRCIGLVAITLPALACAGIISDRDQGETQALEAARKERQELLLRMRTASEAEAMHCETAGATCLIRVDEKREALFEPSPLCADHADVHEFENCQASLLAKQGNTQAVTEFFQYQNACFSKIVGCGDQLRRQADERERTARAEKHRQAMLEAVDVDKLLSDIAFARERVGFLRATVPHQRDEVCQELIQVKGCRDRAKQTKLKLESELQKEETTHDAELAQQLFQAELATQASCFEPEYQCLMDLVDEAGNNRQSKWHFEHNLKLLAQRQRLLAIASGMAVHECVTASDADYGSKIETTYASYAKDPKPPRRVALLQTFALMHTAQIQCLKRYSR